MQFHNFLKVITVFSFFLFSSATCQQSSEKKADEQVPTEATVAEKKPLLTQVDLAAEPKYSDIKKYFKTGDVLIFKEFDPAGLAIAFVEEEIGHVPGYTHVGIIFDLPANNGLPAGLYFWQAIPPKDVFPQTYGNDYFKGAESTGAQMVSLDKIMAYLSTLQGSETEYISIRQLSKPLTDAEKSALEMYARTVDGRSFSYPSSLGMAADYYEGRKGNQSHDNSFFCSKLASQTFRRAGLIDSVITNSVLPGHFAISPGDSFNLITFPTNALDSIVEFTPN